jgi:hypothetical protein
VRLFRLCFAGLVGVALSTGCEASPETSPESFGPDAENIDSQVVPDGDADIVDPDADATNAPDDAQGGGDASDAVDMDAIVVPPPPCLRVEPEGGLDFGLIPGCASHGNAHELQSGRVPGADFARGSGS